MFINVQTTFWDKFGVKGIKIEDLGLKIVDSRRENTRTGLLLCAIPVTATDGVPDRIARNSKPCFCCFGYLGADPNFLICFFQHL